MDLHIKLARPQADFIAWIADKADRTPVSVVEEMVRDGMYIGALNALADLPLVKEHPAIAMISRAMVDYGPTPAPKDGE